MVSAAIASAFFGYALSEAAIRNLNAAYSTHEWREATAVISESYVEERKIKRTRGAIRTFWCPIVSFRYRVNGQEFTASGIMQKNSCQPYKLTAEQVISSYPVGSHHKVFSNPISPSQAVLEKGISFRNWLNLFNGILLLIAGGAIFWSNILISRMHDARGAT